MTRAVNEAARVWQAALGEVAARLLDIPDLPADLALCAREVAEAARGEMGRNARRAAERRLARELARFVAQRDHARLPPPNKRPLPLPLRPGNVVRMPPRPRGGDT